MVSSYFGVGHGREGVADGGRLGGHRQQGRHSQGHSGWGGFGVNPE